MRLKKSRNSADEVLVRLLNEGYQVLRQLTAAHGQGQIELEVQKGVVNQWGAEVVNALNGVFPTELEANQFLHPPQPMRAVGSNTIQGYQAGCLRLRLGDLLKGLEVIRSEALAKYTDLPLSTRLNIEDIDSFSKARDVNPSLVSDLFQAEKERIEVAEEDIQRGLESILGEPFHKKHWGGEHSDLYTSRVLLHGRRRASAFLLKGKGLSVATMQIKHCGANGDQLVKLFESPADLFFVQFVGSIAESLIRDVEGKTRELRGQGKDACYCIIDGLDTARVLRAYGVL